MLSQAIGYQIVWSDVSKLVRFAATSFFPNLEGSGEQPLRV